MPVAATAADSFDLQEDSGEFKRLSGVEIRRKVIKSTWMDNT